MTMYGILNFKQDEHKKFIFFGSLITILILLILAVSVYTNQPNTPHISAFSKASSSAYFPCKDTLYPDVCQSLVLSSSSSSSKDGATTLGDVFDLSLKYTIDQAHLIRSLVSNVTQTNPNLLAALDDCAELLDHSLHQLEKIGADGGHKTTTYSSDDIQTWLSAAITHQTTCLDGLESHEFSKEKDLIDSNLLSNIQHISNSLSLHKTMEQEKTTSKGSGGRKLLSPDDQFPAWVSAGERKLLEASIEELQPNAVVSLDGTGTHKSIAEAIAFVSLAAGSGSGRAVIHVTAGTYIESNLKVHLGQSNIMLVGEGKGKTVISGSKSVGDGYTTFSSATYGVSADGFMARDVTFVNTAGPAKHQAVALRVSSDRSVFYRCSIIGYQDTLYTLSNRQFYRETDIYGTVDYIFGNSAAVFQSCNIVTRKPMASQKNFITAQGRSDPNQNTGFSIQKCQISSESGNPTYFGRPWKKCSRTVIMQSSVSGINSAGWYPWAGGSCLYYGEYSNSGTSTAGRVTWAGVHSTMSASEASQFTVSSLISGNSWLPGKGVVFEPGL